MAIREADFDAFFGKPILREGFTIEEIVREYFGTDIQEPIQPGRPLEPNNNGSGPQQTQTRTRHRSDIAL